MKEGVPSRTAEIAAAARVTEAMKPEQKRVCYDPYARDFLGPIFGAIAKSRLLTRFTLWCVERVAPGLPGEAIGRTKYIDDCLRKCIEDGIEQLVILAAGYDSRAYRFAELKGKVRVFELDFPATQKVKIDKVKKILGYLQDHVVYIPMDFGKERLDEVLFESSYDRNLKTLFIWEGVTYYLTAKAVDDTLAFVVNNSGEGSSIVFDYALKSVLDGACDLKRINALLKFWRRVCVPLIFEDFTFGIEEGTAGEFLSKRGFHQVENVTSEFLDGAYFERVHQKREVFRVCGFVRATVKSQKQT